MCAEAMGYEHFREGAIGSFYAWNGSDPAKAWEYDPLHDDAQAMALVKKMCLYVGPPLYFEELDSWTVSNKSSIKDKNTIYVVNRNLNRAICECVAKMQAAK